MSFATAQLVVARSGVGDDVVGVFNGVLVVADGAGGTGDGRAAAQAVVDAVREAGPSFDPVALLRACDRPARHGGQTTAVVAIVAPDGIRGRGRRRQPNATMRAKAFLGLRHATPVAVAWVPRH